MAGIYGVDIATGQQGINLSTASTQGIQFVIVKAGGANVLPLYNSPYYHTEIDKARAAGMSIGHYWVTGAGDATAQADYFTQHLYGFDPNSQILALDNETLDSNGETWTDAKITTWINRVVANTGIDPKRIWLYMSAGIMRGQATFAQTIATGCRLWVATWGSNNGVRIEPDLGGKFPGWYVQQYWSAASVGGISPVDKSYSPHSIGELFDIATPPPPPPPPSIDIGWGDDPAEFYDGSTSGTVPPSGSNATDVAVYRNGAWSVFWTRGVDIPPPPPPPKPGVGRFAGNGTLISGGTKPPPKPTAGFNYSQSTTSLAVTFSNTSSETGGTIVSSVWNFGDGATSTSANPVHTYAAVQTYTVTLTVTDGYNQTATATKAVTTLPIDNGSGQPTGPGIVRYQDINSTAKFSTRVNAAGSANMVSFAASTFEFVNFSDGSQTIALGASAFGAKITTKGLLGSGQGKTILQMKSMSSNKAGDVPADGSGATNNLEYISVNPPVDGFTMSNLTVNGTPQGHFYNGLQWGHVTGKMTIDHVTFKGCGPGDSGTPPGETSFGAVWHQDSASSVINFTSCTWDGNQTQVNGTQKVVGAALLATNTTSGTININDNVFSGNGYSAAIAMWELAKGGVINIRNSVIKAGNRRSLGGEAMAGTVNIYDPLWAEPVGDDIRITWTSNYNTGTYNVYFSTQAKWDAFIANRTTKKIKTLCTVAQAYGGSAGGAYTGTADIRNYCHIYIAGVKKNTLDYWTFTGKPVN